MAHIKYRKIRRFGTEEVEGILNGAVIVQEKIDGANLSVWLEDGELYIGSRTQIVGGPGRDKGFRGAVESIRKHSGIKRLFYDHPTWRLCGEWLVKHTIPYPQQYMGKFWMFDIQIGGDEDSPEFLDPIKVNKLAKQYGIDSPHVFGTFINPTIEELRPFLEQPNYGEHIEGIVLKNTAFINKFGNGCYGKLVKEGFREANGEMFGNVSKHNPAENQIAMKYVTPGRFLKIANKIEQEKDTDFNLKMMAELMGRMNYDVVSEEIMNFIKKHHLINFKSLAKEISNKTRMLAMSYLEGEDSLIFNSENIGYIKENMEHIR